MSKTPLTTRSSFGGGNLPAHRSLDERLSGAAKPEEANADAVKEWSKAAFKAVAGLMPGGAAIADLLATADTVTERMRTLKIEALLSDYLNTADDQGARLDELRNFVVDPWGNALFEKLRSILNDQPPDPELSKLLANALAAMVGTDARELFEDHKFALGLIEQLSPQQLVVLANHRHWVQVPYANGDWKNDVLADDWSAAFAALNAAPLGLDGSAAHERLSHVVSGLIRQGFVLARGADPTIRIAGADTETFSAAFKACPTDVAYLVLRYVTSPPDAPPPALTPSVRFCGTLRKNDPDPLL